MADDSQANRKKKGDRALSGYGAQQPTSDRKQDREVDGSSGIRVDVYYPGTNESAVEDIKAGRSTTVAKSDTASPPPVKHNDDRMFEDAPPSGIEWNTKRKRRAGTRP